MEYSTKAEAMQHISNRPQVATRQVKMINSLYDHGCTVTQNDLDGVSMDCHDEMMDKAMSY